MKRSLLSLWLGGAVLYAGSTLLLTDAINFQGSNPFRTPPNSALPQIAHTSALPSSPAQLKRKTVTQSEQVAANGATSTSPHATSRRDSPPERTIVDTPAIPLDSEDVSGGAAPTQTPGETPQAPPNSLPNQPDTLRVASAASIRKGPSTSHEIIGTVRSGAEVQVLRRESGWVQFNDPASDRTGWIYSKFLVSDAVTPDTGSAERPPVAQSSTDEPQGAKANRKPQGAAQYSAQQVSPSPAGQRSKAPPSATDVGNGSTRTPLRKQLSQEEPKNSEDLRRHAKSTAQPSEEQVSKEALPAEMPTRKRERAYESSELPPDAKSLPPQWRFGIFARRRMLRDEIATP